MSDADRHPIRWATVALISAVMVVAGTIGWYAVLVAGRPHVAANGVRPDGPTFYQALAEVSLGVANVSGGPWSLFSVYGVAAQSPWSANVLATADGNYTENGCGHEFNGLTLWNGSMPLFNGTFNSGTAPFWQFGFYSASSGMLLVATSVEGLAHVYAPMKNTLPCYPWYDIGPDPAVWTQYLVPLPVNTPTVASVAWSTVSSSWLTRLQPEVEVYSTGPGVFAGWGDVPEGWGVSFDRCGEAGVAGLQPLDQIGENVSGVWEATFNVSTNCALLASGAGVDDGIYALEFSGTTFSNDSAANIANLPFTIYEAFPNGTLTNDSEAWGLANWMTSLDLKDPSRQMLSVGTPTCVAWVSSLEGCPAAQNGWFAVLLSPYGEWLDSYGLRSNGTVGWSQPVEGLQSGQRFAVVASPSWNLTEDNLSVNSTISRSEVVGSTAL